MTNDNSKSSDAAAPGALEVGRPVGAILTEDHAHLEETFAAVVACAQRDDWQALNERWELFERQLASHLAAEECYVLPAFAREHPVDAAGLLTEHAAIKASMVELGLDLDLHCLRAERVASFIESLRAHTRREGEVLYPWASDCLPSGRRSALRAVIGHLTAR